MRFCKFFDLRGKLCRVTVGAHSSHLYKRHACCSCTPRLHGIPFAFFHGSGFPGKHRLIKLQAIARQHLPVCRNLFACAYPQKIVKYDPIAGDLRVSPIPSDCI